MTGATRVHSQLGLKGKGIKVGVIGKGAVLIATNSAFVQRGVSNNSLYSIAVDTGVDFNVRRPRERRVLLICNLLHVHCSHHHLDLA
jgi:hypothetical protein